MHTQAESPSQQLTKSLKIHYGALHDRLDRKADAVSGIASWLSTGYFLSLLLNQSIGWFAFLAGIIVSAGIAITASSVLKLFR